MQLNSSQMAIHLVSWFLVKHLPTSFLSNQKIRKQKRPAVKAEDGWGEAYFWRQTTVAHCGYTATLHCYSSPFWLQELHWSIFRYYTASYSGPFLTKVTPVPHCIDVAKVPHCYSGGPFFTSVTTVAHCIVATMLQCYGGPFLTSVTTVVHCAGAQFIPISLSATPPLNGAAEKIWICHSTSRPEKFTSLIANVEI